MSVAQFDALLAELEPRIKKNTDFCELCVQGSIYSALFCKMKWVNLTIAILDFGACLYGGSETPLKMLATDAKKWNAIQFFFVQLFRRQCVNGIDKVRSYLFFNVRKFQKNISDLHTCASENTEIYTVYRKSAKKYWDIHQYPYGPALINYDFWVGLR